MSILEAFGFLKSKKPDRSKMCAQKFENIKPPRRGDVDIIASTWNPENPLDEVFPNVKGTKRSENGIIDPSGKWMYSKMILPKGDGLTISASTSLWDEGGQAYFTEDILVPVIHREGPHLSGWTTWMSLTPMEIWTQRSGILAATGHVVVGGLGMGWLLRQIAKKPTVTKITVVEKDKDLLKWFGRKVCKNTPKVDAVICDDIYNVARDFDFAKTKFVLDIWESDGRARYDPKLQKLRNEGARVWAWGSARNPNPRLMRHDDVRRAL